MTSSASPPKPSQPPSLGSSVDSSAPGPAESTPPAAGLPAVLSSFSYAAQTSGLLRGTLGMLRVNQTDGFDCPGCAWPDPAERTSFEFCENGARAVTHELDSRRVTREFFQRYTLTELAEKTDHWLEQQGRLVEPMVKREGQDKYEPISWEDAFALMSRELHGLASPHEATFYTSGRTSNEAAFLYQLFVRQWGTNNLPDCSNLCHESSGRGLLSTIGVGKATVTLEDFDKADCILLLGQNPGTNHPRMLATLETAARRGATILSINPLKERALVRFAHPQTVRGLLLGGTRIATHHVSVRINGDVALLKGMMKRLFEAEEAEPGTVLDQRFIREHTTGFEDLRSHLSTVAWADLERDSGLSREAMEEIADVYRKAERAIACWAMGITQHENGVDNVREIANLMLLRGHIGREGAGLCPVRGHSNVQGDRTMGITERPTEAFLQRLDAATGIRSPREPGLDVVESIDALARGKVHVFFALGGNFVAASPDTDHTAAALRQCRLTVQVSTKLNRSHVTPGKTALILPCLGRSEKDLQKSGPQFVTVENSVGNVHRSSGKARPASPALLSEVAIVARLARTVLGTKSPTPWEALSENYDAIRDLIAVAIEGFEDFNGRVRQEGGFLLRNSARERTWRTESQKAHFTAVPLPKHDLAPDELLLMTFRSHDQFNTTVYALNDRYRGIEGERRVVFVHRDDLESRQLRAGDLVDLTSTYDGVLRKAERFRCVPYDIPLGCAAAYFPEANPVVPLAAHSRESGTPASKSVRIRLQRSSSPVSTQPRP